MMANVGSEIPTKIYKSRSPDDRRVDVSERKLQCPFCQKTNLTYRKILSGHGMEGESVNWRVGIGCLVPRCTYVCAVGIQCWKRHIKAYHNGERSTPYCAVALDIILDESADVQDGGSCYSMDSDFWREHTGHCLYLSKLNLDRIIKKKKEMRIEKMRDKKFKKLVITAKQVEVKG